MVAWNLVYSKYALKDAKKIVVADLRDKAQSLLDVLEVDPFQNPPPYEKLVGDLRAGLILEESIFSIAWCMKFSKKKKQYAF